MILLILLRCTGFIKEFKFHYDSINSDEEKGKINVSSNLNSIMILLIQIQKCYQFVIHLKFAQFEGIFNVTIPIFKFHYDSINSLIKVI